MSGADVDKVFAGSIPRLYEEYLVPLIFAPYAEDLAGRVAGSRPRAFSRSPPAPASSRAPWRRGCPRRRRSSPPTSTPECSRRPRRSARRGPCSGGRPTRCNCLSPTANSTPSSASSASCSFPTRRKAFAEARRVLRPGGAFVFNAWDRIEDNEFADVVTSALATFFPADPPRFLARTPHGYHDRCRRSSATCAPAGSRSRRGSTPSRRAARADGAASGDRLLPGNAVAQRDRGARCGASRRGDRLRRRRGRRAASARARSTPRSRRTSSPSSAERRVQAARWRSPPGPPALAISSCQDP